LNDAAIKIQAQYKGFKTRKDLKEAHNIWGQNRLPSRLSASPPIHHTNVHPPALCPDITTPNSAMLRPP
jgi:hypothetical protein